MRFYLGNTDYGWFNFLNNNFPEDINFWQPKGNSSFKILQQGEPFLFKLKKPFNHIGGIGFFSSYTNLSISLAWDIFGQGNGCNSFSEFRQMILKYRQDKQNINPVIGCVVLTNPIFFKRKDWIDVTNYWSKAGIVQGKSFETNSEQGNDLWQKIDFVLQQYLQPSLKKSEDNQFVTTDTEWPGYGKSILQKIRVGQGAFRVLVTDAYNRRCSISGEKTLPVLEAAHIKPYNLQGPHKISNGLLLRSDMHKLFDDGYLTITTDYKIEVSRAIKEEFENGREYYKYHGSELIHLPIRAIDKPNREYIEWHNEIYKG